MPLGPLHLFLFPLHVLSVPPVPGGEQLPHDLEDKSHTLRMVEQKEKKSLGPRAPLTLCPGPGLRTPPLFQ